MRNVLQCLAVFVGLLILPSVGEAQWWENTSCRGSGGGGHYTDSGTYRDGQGKRHYVIHDYFGGPEHMTWIRERSLGTSGFSDRNVPETYPPSDSDGHDFIWDDPDSGWHRDIGGPGAPYGEIWHRDGYSVYGSHRGSTNGHSGWLSAMLAQECNLLLW